MWNKEKGREIRKAEHHVYKASISLRTGTRPVISFVFNGLSLSLDYRTRGFDVVMGSNESIDNVDELMMLVIHQQSRHDIEVPPSRLPRPCDLSSHYRFHPLFSGSSTFLPTALKIDLYLFVG